MTLSVSVQILPVLIVRSDRALGLAQKEVAVDDRRENAWAYRIAAHPETTHVAVELCNNSSGRRHLEDSPTVDLRACAGAQA